MACQRTITDATGSRSFAYNDTLQLAAETNAFGVLVRAYDGLGRSAGFSLFNPANPVNPVQSITYGYDSLGRFYSVSSSVFSALSVAKYSYLPGTDILSGWSSPSGFAVARAFEPHRDLLTAVSNRYNGDTVSAFDYVNDALARRTARIDHRGAGVPPAITNAFGYNPRSELTSAAMGTNAYGYAFDPIGNRQLASANGSTNRYAANTLNQYTNITDGGVVVPQYDLDGNLTNYNGWSFAWDAENRLVLAINAATVVSNCYDYMSRRVAKSVNGSAGQFIYDGWAMIQEAAGTQTNSYVYGLDLSGSMQGAGTIGGILSARLDGTQAFYFYDANGNVSDLTATNGTSLAHYEWDPYGNATVSTGNLAAANPFRFSTKYTDDDTALLYYGYRYYSPELGKWTSRDPIGEQGGHLLYAFLGNSPICAFDALGQAPTWDPSNPSSWTQVPGVWLDGTPGNGRFMPALGGGWSDLGVLEYRNGVPQFSRHAGALIDGQVHVVILDEWDGTGNDARRASTQLRSTLPDGDYVWHHEDIVDVNGKKGVRMVLVPRELNRLPHGGPASWRRAALGLGNKAKRLARSLGRCLKVVAVVSFVVHPGEAIAAPFGGTTELGDATIETYLLRQIYELQNLRNVDEYKQKLLQIRNKYNEYQDSFPWLQDWISAIDAQLRVLNIEPRRP